MTDHQAFKEAWENYPSQDNEGYLPERGGFKCGWFAALRYRDDEIKALREELIAKTRRYEKIVKCVNEQAEDPGLWSFCPRPQYIAEAHLQQELRRLHAVIEEDDRLASEAGEDG